MEVAASAGRVEEDGAVEVAGVNVGVNDEHSRKASFARDSAKVSRARASPYVPASVSAIERWYCAWDVKYLDLI
jgi:hypothetical protein